MSGLFRYELIPPGCGVLCALSGGADSMYLLCRLLEGARQGAYRVCAAHYNHNLRPAASGDEQFVRNWCEGHGIPLLVGSGDVAGEARRCGLGLEECGRAMRYAFLEEAAARLDCQCIATGHHAGDNAETVLMNLVRGSGLKGLTGIPERRGNLIRPMLTLTRGEVLVYLDRHAVPHVEDESNTDPAYTRNFLRTRVLPLLEEINPRVVEHIAAAAARLSLDEEELERQGAALASQAEPTRAGLAIGAGALAAAPRPAALRAAGVLLERAGLDSRAVHREGVLALAAGTDPSASLDVGGGRVYRSYGTLVLSSDEREPAPGPEPLEEGETRWGGWIIRARPALCPPKAYCGPGEFYLRPGDYVIRPRREGDALRLGPRPRKSLKKLMIEQRIPRQERDRTPVLALEDRAAAAGGLGPDRDALAAPGGRCLHIQMRKGE